MRFLPKKKSNLIKVDANDPLVHEIKRSLSNFFIMNDIPPHIAFAAMNFFLKDMRDNGMKGTMVFTPQNDE